MNRSTRENSTGPGVLHVGCMTLVSALFACAVDAGIPAPIPSDPQTTLQLSSSNGYALESISISGSGVSGYATVRIVILVDRDGDNLPDRTRLLATTTTGGGDTYAASVELPDDIDVGPTMICASVDAPTIGFTCMPFEVIAPPPATLSGTISLAATPGPTEILVINARTGNEITSAPIDTAGQFAINDLPPGNYELIVTGDVVDAFEIEPVNLAPGEMLNITDSEGLLRGEGLVSPLLCGLVALGTPTGRIARVTSDVHGHPIAGTTGIDAPNIGRFITGAGGPPVTLTAQLQTITAASLSPEPQSNPAEHIAGVRFRIVDTSNNLIWEDVATDGLPLSVTHPNISSLTPGRYVVGCSTMYTTPAIDSLLGPCWSKYAEFQIVSDPTQDPLYSSGAVNWIPESSRYAFAGWMPDIAGALSVQFPDDGLYIPYLGDVTNRFNAGVYVSGFIDLDGNVEMTGSRAAAQVQLLGRTIYNESFFDFLDGSTVGSAGSVFGGPLGPFGEQRDPSEFTLQSGPHVLYSFFNEWPVWSGEVLNLWGILVVRISIDLALEAYAYLTTTQQAIKPRLGATLAPEAIPSLDIAVRVKLLLGLAKGRANVRTEALLSWPVEYDSESVPNIFLNDPCIGMRMVLTASAKVLRKRKHLSPREIFCTENGSCVGFCGANLNGTSNPVQFPDVYASPSVAAGPNGRVIAAYVEDTNSNGTAPDTGNPTQAIIARFWNPGGSTWGVPITISDEQFAASDPAVTFAGNDGDAWVVYTQNSIDENAGPAGEDLSDALAAQEIVAAFWDESLQSVTREFLTSDGTPIGDGNAAIDADPSGATIAWVRDPDGDVSTRNDWSIAVRNWISGIGWDDVEILDASAALDSLLGGTADALNAEISVTRRNGIAYLVWTADADADIDTHDDRRIVLAIGSLVPNPTGATPHYFTWSIEAPADLPAGAEQPSADVNHVTNELELALTVRGKDADGQTDTGVGTHNTLWSATRATDGTWTVEQRIDDGLPIRCEAPELRVAPTGDVVVLIRRFESDSPGRYRGQLALAVRSGSEWSAPAWITDDQSQHWDQSLAIDTNGLAFLLEVNRLDAPLEAPAITTSACLPVADVNVADEPVQFRTLPADADPELLGELTVSSMHAAENALVTVAATVRNAGLQPATDIHVQFFDGPDEFAPLLDEVVMTNPLAFNETAPAAILIERRCGPQPIFARLYVDAPGVDRCPLNNESDVLDIGHLPPPQRVSATISTGVTDAVDITAIAPAVDAIAGYRILRAANPGGPYEIVGESVQPVLTDRLVTRCVTYYYTLVAFDACGTVSTFPEEASVSLPDIIGRQWALPFSGTWQNPNSWVPPGIPGEGDDCFVGIPGSYTISLAQDATAGSLAFGFPPGNTTINLNNNTLSLLKPSLVAPGGRLLCAGGTLECNLGQLANLGTLEARGPGNSVHGILLNEDIGQLQVRAVSPAPADLTFNQGLQNNGQIRLESGGFPVPVTLQINNGTLANGPTGQITSVTGAGPENIINAPLHNEGTVTVNKDLRFDRPLAGHANLGTINLVSGNLTFALNGPDATVVNAGAIDVSQVRQFHVTGGSVQNGGSFTVATGAAADVSSNFAQQAGTTICDGMLTAQQVDLEGGTLTGSGQVNGPMENSAGTVRPGGAPGMLSIFGDYTQGPDGVIHIELANPAPVTGHDLLSVTGNVSLDGTLVVELIAGFDPPVGMAFDIVTTTGGTITGQFSKIEPAVLPNGRSVEATYLPDRVRLTVGCALYDGDCDGDVDNDDYAQFADCVAGPNTSPDPTPPFTTQECIDVFDGDGDADVDLLDFAELATRFTGN